MNFRRAFTPLALVLVGAAPMMAQETVGALVGTVTNNVTKKPLAGVKLTLRSPKMLGERTAVTNADGTYRFNLLPNGEYSLSLSTPNFNGTTVKMAILPGQTTRQDARLAPVQAVTVEVVADSAAQIDKTETTVQTVYSMDSIANITGGDLTRIMDVAPAVTSGSTDKGNTVTIRGGNTTGAKFLVNGLDASDPGWGTFDASKMMISDMVETVAVVASPLNARFGNTESGMISYVTTRGSNEFKGSVRTSYTVNGTFGTTPYKENNRASGRFGDNDNDGRRYPLDGSAFRNWEATISGPIWKDHITFAWGGRFYPSTSERKMVAKTWNPDGGTWSASQGGMILPLGPGGAQIRKADVYDMGKYYDKKDSTSFNQYALFWQINSNHSLDWSYSEFKDDLTDLYDGSANINSPNYYNVKNNNRIWNLAYKGLIGPGVLEARMGRTTYDVIRPDTTDSKFTSIATQTVGSWFNGGLNASSGLASVANLGPYGGTTSMYPYLNQAQAQAIGGYQWSKKVAGSPFDKGETKSNTSLMVNYQMAPGSHLIDVGVNYVKTHWDTSIGDAGTSIFVPGGQVARDLTDADILYPAGYAGPRYSAADYAGKWLVWDAHALTSSLYPNYPDPSSLVGLKQFATGAVGAPSMTKYYGQEGGGFDEKTTSLYVNDNWQVNNHIGLMGGLRYDKFSLDDSVGSVLSYGVLSPRFEIKYDLGGDQKRVLSYSWAKFNNRMPSAAFLSLVHRRKPYSITKQWDTGKMGVDANGNPVKGGYRTVSTEELLDSSNYTYYTAQNNPDIYKLGNNFKGDYTIEHAVNFRRAYENGSNWRAGIVYRKWGNNYQWFMDTHSTYIANPYGPAVDTTKDKETDPLWTPHRVLRNDDRLFHTYHSFELEWNFVLSKKVTFSGNYTYSRNFSNQMYYAAQSNFSEDNVGVRHAPWGINVTEAWQLVGVSLDDQAQVNVSRNQLANAWVTYDLSRGALKQSLVLRGRWNLGQTYTDFNGNMVIDPFSQAWKNIVKSAGMPADFPTGQAIKDNYGRTMHLRYPGTNIGDWKEPEDLSFSLKYNLEVPINNQLHWWAGIEVVNVFGLAYNRNQVNYLAQDGTGKFGRANTYVYDGSRPGPQPAANGYRIATSEMYKPNRDFIENGRYFNFETGIRF